MRLAIMQPYFFPYIGYFQLISAVDLFIVYDNIKYSKKGWINRNRILQNGKDKVFSLPLKGGSDYLNICERELAPNFDRDKLLNQIKNSYRCAPNFALTFPLVEQILRFEDPNLFLFLLNLIKKICDFLNIKTEIKKSSDISINHDLKKVDKVIGICAAVDAKSYINTIGGKELYSKDTFLKKSIELKFIQSKPFEYSQFGDAFIPWLSIIDVIMFNPIDTIKTKIITNFELI